MAILDTPHPRPAAAPPTLQTPPAPSRTDRLVRADDQLSLTLEFLNLDVDPRRGTLIVVDPRQPFTGVRMIFGSQHTVEDTIGAGDPASRAGVDHRTARESRLVVALPTGTPYTLKAILDLAGRALALDDRAVPGRKPRNLGEPDPGVTALEVVDSLVFSPEPQGRFFAGTTPVTRADVTELWRARLGSDPAAPDAAPVVRALWSRPDDPSFDRPLDADDRQRIVTATTVDPAEAIEARRLWLSPHGSFLDLSGAWGTGPDDLADDQLAAYLHHTAAGRDLHVEVIDRGFLAPFGIPATISTITERQFRSDDAGGLTAVLVQEDYLSVSPASVDYPAPHMPHGGRAVPFTRLAAADPGRGPIARTPVVLTDGTAVDPAKIAIITRDGADIGVGYAGTDRTGRTGVTFTLPAIFVAHDHAFTVQDEVNGIPTPLGNLARYFAEAPVEADLGAQSIGWADPDPRGPAGSDRSTDRIRFTLDRPDLDGGSPGSVRDTLEAAGRPAFYPRVSTADVTDDATSALVGGASTEVTYATAWLEHGNGTGNPGLAFHTLVNDTTVDRAGAGEGLIRPSLRVDTFSQTLGSGIELTAGEGFAGGDNPILSWDPAAALGDAATLFGSIVLTDIVEQVDVALDEIGGDTRMPKMQTLIEEEGITYLLSWEPTLKTLRIAGEAVFVVAENLEDEGLPAFFGDKATSAASIRLSQLLPFDADAAATTDFELRLDNVTVRLPPGLPAIAIAFRTLRYSDPGDGTPDLDSVLADWVFTDVLAFLEPVRELVVTLLDLGDIQIGPDGVVASAEVPAPNLSFGVLGVAGLTVGLGLDLPNDGSSTIGFNLSRRTDPFRITLMGFGGTGSLELQLVADDIDFLIASMAVTYELAADLVVVSASLSASLGIELAYADRAVTLEAYVELKGNASVLGLLNITGTVLLALRYNLGTKLLKGIAAMSAEVDSLFGKSETSWRQTVEVSLASDDAGRRVPLVAGADDEPAPSPSFGDRFSADQWTAYCAAFS